MPKHYKRRIDNKMHGYGDISFKEGLIRVNAKRSKSPAGKKLGGVIDSMVHEEQHRLHPKMYEKNIKKQTSHRVKNMSKRQKSLLRSKYN